MHFSNPDPHQPSSHFGLELGLEPNFFGFDRQSDSLHGGSSLAATGNFTDSQGSLHPLVPSPFDLTFGGLSSQTGIAASSGSEIIFVDAGIEDLQGFLRGLTPGSEVVVLDPTQDGVQQITDILTGRYGVNTVSSVQIISHGESGRLQLGTTQLDVTTLSSYANDLQLWGGVLQEHADILLYGCNVAAGDRGSTFMQALSQLTGADVAASTDLTGSSQLGGDWELEYQLGAIEATSAIQPWLQESYDAVLAGAATFSVNLTSNDVQTSNYGSNSFQITNTGDKKIARIDIDATKALYPDIVFDPFGLAGDTVSKSLTIDSNGSTGIVSPSSASYVGLGGTSGYKGLTLLFNETVNGGFEAGETVGFAIDMDSNSIAGGTQGGLNSGSSPAWDVGGVSGAEMIGSTFKVTFTDGTTATGQLQGAGNQGGSQALASQTSPNLPVSLTVNGLVPGGIGTYGSGGPSVIINGQAGQTARVVLTKGFIQPVTVYAGAPSGLQSQLDALAATGFPANNAVEFQTKDILLTGGNQDISGLFNFSGVANYNFTGEDTLPLGFVASVIDPQNNNLPIGAVTQPIYLKSISASLGVTLTQSGGSTDVVEGGASDTYSLVLKSQPTANVTVALNPGTQLTTSASSLIFTPANWNVAQTVTVTAVNDTLAQGDRTVTIAHTVSSTDANYNGLTIAPLTVAITDNDPNTVPGSIFINSGGGAYTDDLGQIWSADQLFTGGVVYSTTAAIANTTKDSLFQTERTGANFSYAIPVANGIYEVDLGFAELYWNAANARVFSVTGEGQTLLSNYDVWTDAGGQNKAVIKKFNVNVTDGILNLNFTASKDQAKVDFIELTPTTPLPGVSLAQTGGTTAVTEGGATDTYSLVLSTQPTANVTVTLNPGTQLNTNVSNLTFTPANWNVAQTVTVTAVDDLVVEGNHTGTITHTVTSTDPNYTGVTIAPLSVAITDNDVPAGTPIRVEAESTSFSTYRLESNSNASGGQVLTLIGGGATETGTASFTFNGAAGTYDVVVGYYDENDGVSSATLAVGGVSASWQFNANLNSNAANSTTKTQKTVLSGIAITPGTAIQLTGSEDQGEPARVDFIDFIPTTATPGVTLTQSGGSTAVTEGGTTDTYSLVLKTQPTANVTVALNGGAQLTTNVPSLTFTPVNWNTAQTVTVTAVNDLVVEGNHTGTITHTVTSTDPNYTGVTIAPLSVAITDNDVPAGTPIRVEAESTSFSTYRLESNSNASGGQVLTLIGGGATETGTASFTFNGAAGTYDVVVGYYDENDGVSSATLAVGGVSASWQFNANLNSNAANSTTKTQKTVLSGIAITPGTAIQLMGSEDQGEPARVDFIDFIPTTATPGVTPAQSGGSTAVTEGGATDTYSLVLNTQPTANVTIALNAGTQLTTSATSLTFTPANWNVAQTVTVSAVDDTAVEGNHTGAIAYTVSSTDPKYNGLTIAPLTVAITDNDTNTIPGSILINTGGGAYTDSLGQVWSADQLFTGGTTYSTTAAIANTTSDPLFQNERTGTTFSYAIPVANGAYTVDLGFAELYWNAANSRVFSVTGEGQSLLSNYDLWTDAGGQNNAIIKTFTVNVTDGILNLNFAASKDQAKVDFIKVIPTAQLPGVTPAQSGGSTAVTEGGATDTYSLVLNTQPTANVTIALNAGTQLTTSATSLTFTPANWNVAQTVTVSAVDDTAVEGNHTGAIAYTVSSTDPKYNGLTIAPLTVAITDNDGSPTEIHLNIGGGAYTDSIGEAYLADQYFSGGNIFTTGVAISGTIDDPLFQTERSGTNFSYAIPVINGIYNIDLGFAEIYWGAAGQRVFDVTVEGQLAIDNLDIWSQVGKNAALTKLVSGISVTDGILNLNFTSSVDQAKVSFIGVHPYLPDSSDPFLHVVIDAPSFVVDYNGNGTEVVPLLGNQSHTHEFGKSLTSYTWQTGSTVLGAAPNINAVLGLGQNSVSLTIGDNNAPPRTLTNSVNIGVYPLNAVGGVLTKYYPTVSSYFSTLLDTLPSSPGFIEVLPTLKVTEDAANGLLGTSTYSGDVIAAMTGKFQASTTGSYTFQVNGGSGQRVLINGSLVTGAIALTAGTKYDIEVRVARSASLTAPIEVLAAVNGGVATAIASSTLTNDESTLKPFINSMPTGGSSLGGETITIKGVAFFEGDTASQVKVKWGNTILTGSALTIRQGTISFVTPPGAGTVLVAVETPNGVSTPVNFTYTTGTVPINFTTPQIVATMTTPTQGAWGPDGRLYVGSTTGVINAYTFDSNYNVIATQTINTLVGLSNNNILGIAFNPYDATGQPKIYVAHSQLFANGGAAIPAGAFSPYSGQVSVLTGPSFSTITPLITGLPVSNHDHGINGMTFDDTGNLLIAVGGNTNAGVAGNSAIGALPESPLSGAILKANVTKPNFNGAISYTDNNPNTNTDNNQVYGDLVSVVPGVDVSVYASGFRNPFDIVWTTNGLLYGLDNGPNSGFGAASTSATTQGPDPNNPDELNLIQPGIYYGHPNRNRGRSNTIQNVYYGPTAASISGVYMAPLTTVNPSTDGLDEYRATTFNSQLRGNLLGQQWNGSLYNFDLSPDGMQVTTSTLPNNPTGLDIVTGPGGVLISVDYQDNYITVSKPIDAAAVGVTAYDIFPWRAPAAGGGSFVIGGANFGNLSNTTVTIGGKTAILTSVTPTQIKGILSANPSGASGLLDIVVASAGQTSVIPAGFKYLG